MAREWYVKVGETVEGPFTSRELADRAASGHILPTDTISPDRTKWVPAAKVKGLSFPERATTRTIGIPSPAVESNDDAGRAPLLPLPSGPLEDVPGYKLEGVLGEGGMGIVYRARQLKLDRVVALKTVALTGAAHTELLQRFEKEAVALAKLQHPNIVSVYDFGRVGERLYFAMELLDGEDFDRLIERRGALDERTAWLIARQTAAALAHASNHNITHRDIKPANLFLIPAPLGSGLPPGVPMVKVTDFGLALTRGQADQRLTTTGTMIGTPIYMAPEQFKTSSLGHLADIYSLGASMYHALSGKLPFNEPSVWELMLAKTKPAPRLAPPASEESIELVAMMMAGNPAVRPATYEELIARIDELPCLREVDRGPSEVVRQPVRPSQTKKRPLFVAVGVAVFLVAAGVGYAIFGRGSTTSTASTVQYVPSGTSVQLYNATSVIEWQGQGWSLEDDEDKNRVLSGQGKVRRAFDPLPHYRVTLGVDIQTAKFLDVVFIVPQSDTPRTVLRLARDGVVVGTRVGDTGKLNPIGEAVPFPTAEQLATKGAYREVIFERAGSAWRVSFDRQPVATIPDDGTPKLPEFYLLAEGGAIRIETARLEELTETK